MVSVDGVKTIAFIGDWGIATKSDVYVGTTGKKGFVPFSCIDIDGMILGRNASLLYDLESLFLVAVCCHNQEIAGVNSRGIHRLSDCFRASGLDGEQKIFHGEWAYLSWITKLLSSDIPDTDEIVRLFVNHHINGTSSSKK